MSSNVGIGVSEGARVETVIDAIERVKNEPHEFSKDTNRDIAIILNHPMLNPSALPGNMELFDKYNGTGLSLLS